MVWIVLLNGRMDGWVEAWCNNFIRGLASSFELQHCICMHEISGLVLILILQNRASMSSLLQWCFVDEEEYVCIYENLHHAPSHLFVSYCQESQVEV